MASDHGAMSRCTEVEGKMLVEKRCFRPEKSTESYGRIFDMWQEAKIRAGYEHSSDTDFAAHLLSLEFRRR
jgi:hypothetical protein